MILSEHLSSRTEVGDILRSGTVPVTVLRAAMIIGSGSASFEILRYLVERLPVIITPRWVDVPCQPIGVRNTLNYLIGCLECAGTIGEDLRHRPGPGSDLPAAHGDLRRRGRSAEAADHLGADPDPAAECPVDSPADPGAGGPGPAAGGRAAQPRSLPRQPHPRPDPQELFDCRLAIRLALERVRQHQIESSWTDAGEIPPAEWSTPGDPSWAGGTFYDDSRQILLAASPDEVWKAVIAIGGESGWYYADWLWKLRGILDRLVGGVGLHRGRRCPLDIAPGEALDFWRVVDVTRPHRLLLVAEMKLPGEATLEFRLEEVAPGQTMLQQVAHFLPRGLLGLLYWYAVTPFHNFIFNGMLRGFATAISKPVLRGPERMPERP